MGMVGLRDVLVVAPATSFHTQHHHESLLSSPVPLLTASPSLVDDNAASRAKPTGINLWQNQLHHHHHQLQNPNPNPNLSYLKKPMPMPMLDGVGGGSVGVGTSTCQDCGNQAKKDCSHSRCRTCCKNRGFDCSTHVKSTWVPAGRRRERQLSVAAAAGSSASTSASKKPRLLSSHTNTTTSTSNNSPPRSHDTTSSHQDAGFRENLPGHVRAPAVFKCVRVTSVEDGEDEYAYQAMVSIGGHLFKGFLYDQGVEEGRGDHTNVNNTNTSNNNNTIPNISELHLGGGRNGSSDVYGGAPAEGGLLGGTTYGNPIN